jgi:alkaline phosphatase D
MADDHRLDRRTLLSALATGSLATVLPEDGLARASRVDRLPSATATNGPADASDDSVFPQGVASGDPTSTGVVLWTRLDPGSYRERTGARLEVAPDDSFNDPSAWTVPADRISAGSDFTVKVDLDGALEPDRRYAYRFAYDGATSPVGRCRTLPAPDSSPDSLRLAMLTCQNYRNGYYGAYHHVAQESVDFLLHLGDFIYEDGGESPLDGRDISLPSGEDIAMGLEDYRHLYRTYRSDRFLRAALAEHSLIATWDDHEIVNNRFWSYAEERPYAGYQNHPRNDDAAFMTQLFADGIRAWWEYLPTRVRYDPDADSLLDQLQLWRSFQFGDLVELLVTDERLFRSSSTEGTQAGARVEATGDVPGDLDETILGADQREWFLDCLRESEATWTAWANEVVAMDLQLDWDELSLFNADSWDGFEPERERIMATVRDAPVENFVALTGDLHTAVAGYLHRIYDDDRGRPDKRLGVEFVAPAISSNNLMELLGSDSRELTRLLERLTQRRNPHVDFFDSHNWGYGVVEFTPEAATYSVYGVDKTTDSTDTNRRLLGRFRCPTGEYRLERLDGDGDSGGLSSLLG